MNTRAAFSAFHTDKAGEDWLMCWCAWRWAGNVLWVWSCKGGTVFHTMDISRSYTFMSRSCNLLKSCTFLPPWRNWPKVCGGFSMQLGKPEEISLFTFRLENLQYAFDLMFLCNVWVVGRKGFGVLFWVRLKPFTLPPELSKRRQRCCFSSSFTVG